MNEYEQPSPIYHPKESTPLDHHEIDLESMDLVSRQQFWLRNQQEKQFILRRELYLQPPSHLNELTRPTPVTTDWEHAKKASMAAQRRMQEQEEERRVIYLFQIGIVSLFDIRK